MNFTLQLKFISLTAFYLLIGAVTSNAQCRFSTQLEQLEYIALKAIYNANPNNTLSNEWRQLANNQSCDVCLIPETYCDVYGQLKGLSIGRKNISKLPREIAALSELQFFDLQNNNLTCLPLEADALCSAEPFGEALKGNPIHELINWMDFCTYPRDICLPSLTPPSACNDLAIFNYLDTVYLLGLGESYNKVEIIGAPTNWKVLEICSYCTNFQLITDLPEGDYTLKINIRTPNDGHCYREEKISISKNGNPTPPTPPSTGNGALNCHNLLFFGSPNRIEVDGLSAFKNKVEIIGQATNWRIETLCDGNCNEYESFAGIPVGTYTVKVNQADINGNHCYREQIVTVKETDDTPIVNPQQNDISCDFITFQGAGNQIYIYGLTAKYNKVEYIGAGTNWRIINHCDGDCAPNERISDLPEGSYQVKINQRGVDGQYCYREEVVQVLRGSTNRNSLTNQEDLIIYPNPAKDYLKITMSDFQELTQLKIYNAFGHLVKTIPKQAIGNNTTIDLTGFENGLYLLSVFQNQSRVITKRFLVEHLR